MDFICDKIDKEIKMPREYKIKPVDELEFTDDFMFGTIMQDEEICKGVLERLLKTKISRIVYPKLQESVSPFYDSKSVRFDVYLDDGVTVYDIEMQNKKLDSIEKRVRYYQSMIDIDQLSKGTDYSDLKESYVIFICKTDPFDFNCPSYEVISRIEGETFLENTLEKKEISEIYDDKTHKLFFNAKAYEKESNLDLKAFLQYLSKSEATDGFTKILEEKVMVTKKIDKFRKDYFSWALAERDAHEEGRAEGRAEGRLEGRAEGRLEGRAEGRLEGRAEGRIEGIQQGIEDLAKLLKSGFSLEDALKQLGR